MVVLCKGFDLCLLCLGGGLPWAAVVVAERDRLAVVATPCGGAWVGPPDAHQEVVPVHDVASSSSGHPSLPRDGCTAMNAHVRKATAAATTAAAAAAVIVV